MMAPQSLGKIIEQMRKKTSSLGKLEKATGKDRSSIRRYERDEVPPPLEVAENMANVFYRGARDRDRFLKLCREALKIDNKEAKADRKRKREHTAAARKYACEIRLSPFISQKEVTVNFGDGRQMKVSPTFFNPETDQKIKYERIDVEVRICRRKSREPILRILLGKPPEKFIWHKEKGAKIGYFTKEKLDPKQYLMLCNRLKPKVGPFALLDLAAETIKQSDVLMPETYQSMDNKEVGVWISMESLEGFLGAFEFIQQELKNSGEKNPLKKNSTLRQALQGAIAHAKYYKSRPKELGRHRSELLNDIQKLATEITRIKQPA